MRRDCALAMAMALFVHSVAGATAASATRAVSEAGHAATTNASLSAVTPAEDDSELHGAYAVSLILLVLGVSSCCVYALIKFHFHYLPESVAVVFVGALVGIILRYGVTGNWAREESMDPTTFFIVLLPPIIFESGYNIHKGNFFRNIGSITVFAVFGTIISAVVIALALYLLGVAGVSSPLTLLEAFTFGSLISAVDPVATLAIFGAIDVDPTLNMLVFGESVLNDAVSIVLVRTVVQFADTPVSGGMILLACGKFLVLFLGSAAIGVIFALATSLFFKHIAFRSVPSIEFSIVIMSAYFPFVFAEALQLSGIMAILFAGMTMAHYLHFNLSPTTQITAQATFRSIAYLAETAVFAYLGMAIFSFNHNFSLSFTVWSIVLCLIARAANVFPLTAIVNRFRQTKISGKFQFIMWFSGLRGAIAFVLSMDLSLKVFTEETRSMLITSTLAIVLFTILVLGGATFPLIKMIGGHDDRVVGKTQDMGNPVDISDIEAEERRQSVRSTSWFERIDKKYMIPFFRRVLTTQDLREARIELQQLRTNWYSALPHDAEELAQLEEMDHLRDRRNEDGGGSETTGEELTTVVDEMSPAPRRSSSEPIRKRADD